jgi:hypothetical protein
MAEEELDRAYESNEMLMIIPQTLSYEEPLNLSIVKGFKKTKKNNFSSNDMPHISKDKIRKTLMMMV